MTLPYQRILSAVLLLSIAPNAAAYEPVHRLSLSVRSLGMGGARVAVGEYEDSFFSNPARFTFVEEKKVTLFHSSGSVSFATLGALGSVLGASDPITGLSEQAGKPLHGRGQTFFPSLFYPQVGGNPLTLAVSFLLSSEIDLGIRNSYRIDPILITDSGPVLSASYRILDSDKQGVGTLAVGATLSALYRFSAQKDLTALELLQGQAFGPRLNGQEALFIDLGVGITYRFPPLPKNWMFESGLAMHGLFGGAYGGIPFSIRNVGDQPRPPARTISFGVQARKEKIWRDSSLSLATDFQELGSGTGNALKRLHLGAEWEYRIFRARVGVHQGYGTLGFGMKWKYGGFDLAYFSEEMGRNVGDLQDRRLALHGFVQITL